MTEEAVRLVDYDATWPRRFEEERDLLVRTIEPWIHGSIEHVGSTAVPNLTAKPVIDIMVGVRDLPSSLDARAALATIGYVYSPYRSDVMHWFCKPSPAHRTHHLHLVPFEGALWVERLAFRDYLCANATVAQEYAELKRSLAARHRLDREAYTDAKGAFVQRITDLALGRHRIPQPPDRLRS